MEYKAVSTTTAISCFPAFRMKFKAFQMELCACATLVSFVTVRTITMETVIFGSFFFRAPAPAKFKLRKSKTIKKGKVWSWYKANERGKHVLFRKSAPQSTLPAF